MTRALTLESVVCPGCAEQLSKKNRGCPHCGYEDNNHGRILTLGEMAKLAVLPEPDCMRFNDVSPKFIAAVIEAARSGSFSALPPSP